MRGYRLLDEVGAKVGVIEDHLGDWLVVRLGRIGEVHTLVPAADAVAAGGHVWVPYRLGRILEAVPLAAAGNEPSPRIERELRMHYGLPAPVLTG